MTSKDFVLLSGQIHSVSQHLLSICRYLFGSSYNIYPALLSHAFVGRALSRFCFLFEQFLSRTNAVGLTFTQASYLIYDKWGIILFAIGSIKNDGKKLSKPQRHHVE